MKSNTTEQNKEEKKSNTKHWALSTLKMIIGWFVCFDLLLNVFCLHTFGSAVVSFNHFLSLFHTLGIVCVREWNYCFVFNFNNLLECFTPKSKLISNWFFMEVYQESHTFTFLHIQCKLQVDVFPRVNYEFVFDFLLEFGI